MYKNQINTVLKQAHTTFTSTPEIFFQNLEILKTLMDNTSAENVNLHAQFANESYWNQPNKAPVSCIDIYDHHNFTMGIFILKHGAKVPLHNHPEMYGLIKVILGKVKITSYSLNTEKTNELDQRKSGLRNQFISRFINKPPSIVTAELAGKDFVDANSECCILEPEKRNLHEIESVDGPAAFLDILAPPYGTSMPNSAPRLCTFYTILSQSHIPSVFKLQAINSPSSYWTDTCPYNGPELLTID